MENTVLRIIEKLFIIYFAFYFLFDIILFVIFLLKLKSSGKKYEEAEIRLRKATILVPAFNEEVSILNCLRMLMNIDYPEYEIIVINDGSKDKTKEVILGSFDFVKKDLGGIREIRTSMILGTYETPDGKLKLIDKLNGGKADSINAGINLAQGEFVCTIDADSILDSQSLRRVLMPMHLDDNVIASGGQLAISNDTVIENGRIVNMKMPDNIWVMWQIIEYIKTFLVSRLGLSKLNSLLIMSGAFSAFRTSDLLKAGGYLTYINDHEYIRKIFDGTRSTVCEDMEIIVRLRRYYYENNLNGKVICLPKPLCWTEVPDNSRNVIKQRARWHLGLAECLSMHCKMMFDPKYGTCGVFAFPYYTFFELFSPLIKILAFMFIIVAALNGMVNTYWLILMGLFITVTTALVMSVITVVLERWSEKKAFGNIDTLRYKSFYDWFKLIISGILGDFSYSYVKMFSQLKGLVYFATSKSEWNKFERKGIRQIVDSPTKIG